MTIKITHPSNAESAERDLAERYPFVTHIDVPPTNNALHWHSFDAEFYICSGDVTVVDEAGEARGCGPGVMVAIPQRALHKESSPSGYSVILGTSVAPDAFGDPVDRPADTLS